MGEFTGVGLGTRSPDMMGKLSQLLSVQAQKQALAGQAAEVAGAQQTQQQRAGVAQWMKKKLGTHLKADGTIDTAGIAADEEFNAAAGDTAPQILSNLTGVENQQIAAKQGLFNLTEEQRAGAINAIAPALNDPSIANIDPDAPDAEAKNEKAKQAINDYFIRYAQSHNSDPALLQAIAPYAAAIKNAPPGAVPNVLRTMVLGVQDVSKQKALRTPDLVNKGDALTNVNPLADKTDDIKLKLSPGYQDTVDTDQLGNKFRVIRDKGGNVVATVNMSGEAGGPASFGVGERDTFEKQAVTNFENVDKNRTSASGAPQQLDQINKALELSKDVSTGAWAQKRAQIESGIGSLIPGYAGMDDASKLQELDKFTERIATDASKVLGVNAKTDAERESIHKQNANIGYTPQAIQAVLKYAKAQTLAIEAKGNAQETWLKSNKITKQHEFETDFRKAYDPRVFQFEAMEPAEQEKFLQSLSKEDRKTIREKTKALIDMGAIPGG